MAHASLTVSRYASVATIMSFYFNLITSFITIGFTKTTYSIIIAAASCIKFITAFTMAFKDLSLLGLSLIDLPLLLILAQIIVLSRLPPPLNNFVFLLLLLLYLLYFYFYML